MNPELARLLKEKGFPQDPSTETHAFWISMEDGKTYMPDLSELIRACGDDFYCVRRRPNGDFQAQSVNKDKVYAFGSTPEEAVASLWLELQK